MKHGSSHIELVTATFKERERIMNLLKKFLASEDGPTAVEYAVMLALIVVVCIGTISAVGTKVNTSFDSTKTALP